jgi:hypothetical protein
VREAARRDIRRPIELRRAKAISCPESAYEHIDASQEAVGGGDIAG